MSYPCTSVSPPKNIVNSTVQKTVIAPPKTLSTCSGNMVIKKFLTYGENMFIEWTCSGYMSIKTVL